MCINMPYTGRENEKKYTIITKKLSESDATDLSDKNHELKLRKNSYDPKDDK